MADDRLVHVVDDEDAVRRSLDFALRTAGFEVEKWPDGETFLKGADRSAQACERERLLSALEIGFDRLADREGKRQREQWAKTQIASLTQREQEVLEGLACGYPNKTIAYDLGISSRTVEVYRANAMEKLEVTNFADALRVAFAAGMGSEKEWRERYAVGAPKAGQGSAQAS